VEVEYASAFLRIYKKLHPPVQDGIKGAAKKVIDYYAMGGKTPGLGIRNLQGDIWEARFGLDIRIVYRLGRNHITFILAGTHKDVHNFLRHA
jgi:mRNA-degrading endonuclease YafQ of YafQ-DinJ toxin-antitoxin module